MKHILLLITIFILVGLASCERENSPVSYLDYLSDKTINGIHLIGDTVYVQTWRQCKECDVPSFMSYIPEIHEWTLIKGTTFKNYSLADFSGIPVKDNKGDLYIARGNTIYKLTDKEYKPLLNTGNYTFNSFTFDNNNNIWFSSDINGIAFWNKSELKIYNAQNSQLPTNRIHGLAVDKSGTVWVSLDFKGLLKITNSNWQVIPNTEIPGLNRYSYLRGPKIVTANGVWFEVFSPDTTSNILKLENNNWIYEFPEAGVHSILNTDSQGTVWAISNRYENSKLKRSTLKYYRNNEWIDFNVSDITQHITTVNADESKVYIGTVKGLVVKTR